MTGGTDWPTVGVRRGGGEDGGSGGPRGPRGVGAAGGYGGLRDEVRALLVEAAALSRGGPAEGLLLGELDRLDGPLRVALAGRVKAGKSTLLNALAGEQIAATDATECTRVVTSYAYGAREAAWAYLRDGSVAETRLVRGAGSAHVDLSGGPYPGGPGGLAAADVDALRIELPNPRLRRLTLIDTPGIASLSTELSERAESFLNSGVRAPGTRRGRSGAAAPDRVEGTVASARWAGDDPEGSGTHGGDGLGGGAVGGADAVIYLLRFLHAADVGFLESFRRTGIGEATPAHALAVLSRADELAPGRAESVDVARRAAADIGRDERVRALVQTVVPVSGLLAQAPSRLSADELGALLALAAEPVADTDGLLLSADRFVAPAGPSGHGAPTALPPALRALLLDRLGLAGVRLAVGLARLGQARDPAALAAALAARSGLPELRTLLRDQFTDRADVLKAQRALRVLDAVLDEHPPAASAQAVTALRERRERVEAGAHALAELRLLGDLRTGVADIRGLAEDRRDEMERLLGTAGTAAHTRLGLPAAATAADLRAALLPALDRYRRLAENRLAPRPTRRAAAVVRRTCEGLLRELPPGP